MSAVLTSLLMGLNSLPARSGAARQQDINSKKAPRRCLLLYIVTGEFVASGLMPEGIVRRYQWAWEQLLQA